MAKSLQEYIEQQKAEPKAAEPLTDEELKLRKFEKMAFDYANTIYRRGGCFTSEQMRTSRAAIQAMIDKGEIKL